MRLYYYTAKQWGLKALWEKRLKVSEYEQLNDPFELLPFEMKTESEVELSEHLKKVFSKHSGIICFSEVWTNHLMWAHYGDKHRGMCLGFDIPDNHPGLTKIQYVTERVECPPDLRSIETGLSRETLNSMLHMKHSGWSYEREHRLRTRRRAGLGIGHVTRILAGRKHSPSLLSVSHTLELSQALGIEHLDLLWAHTLFPYTTAFAIPGTFQNSLQKALGAGYDGINASYMQSASDYVRTRRLCPKCAVEDLHRWGESYWRREHHLPACFVCVKHSQGLIQTSILVVAQTPWPDLLPHEVLKARTNRILPVSNPDLALHLAETSVNLLRRDNVCPVAWSLADYRRQLEDKGLVAPQRMVNRRKFANWGQETFGSTLDQIGFRPADKTLNWLAHLVRVNTFTPLTTVKHVLFNALLAKGKCRPGLLTHVPTGMQKKRHKAV